MISKTPSCQESQSRGWKGCARARLAAVLAAGDDDVVQTLPDRVWKLVNIMISVDFDCFESRVQRHLAVLAPFEVFLNERTGLRRDFVVDHFVEQRQKFCAGHFSP